MKATGKDVATTKSDIHEGSVTKFVRGLGDQWINGNYTDVMKTIGRLRGPMAIAYTSAALCGYLMSINRNMEAELLLRKLYDKAY